MSKARELAELIGNAGGTSEQVLGGRRNLIINGAMQVSQRGDYTGGVTGFSGGYYLDRWYEDRGAVAADLQHTSTSPSGYGNSIKITATSSATGEISTYQKLEGTTVDIIKGKTVTLSAWVRSNTSSARLMVYSGAAWLSIPDATHTGGGDWELLTTTFTVPTNAVEGFRPYISIRNADATATAIATGDYIEFTGVQLELGSVATPFEHRSYGEELALCQRYYYVSSYSNANGNVFIGHAIPAAPSVATGQGVFPVPMRVSPSVTFPDGAGQSGYLVDTACNASYISNTGFVRANRASGDWVVNTSGVQGRFVADAEL